MLTDNSVLDAAFSAVDRTQFVPLALRPRAHDDQPLPIGHGQTISQPTTVRRMLSWLDIQKGQTILDVGSGSGWTTALLASIVGPTGHVYAIDIIDAMVRMGRGNCQKIGITNATFALADKSGGLVEHAPYDRIIVSASANEIPASLRDQLAPDGKIVIPVGEAIIEATKTAAGWNEQRHPGYIFVPYISQK